ncbi:DUF6484 domain-containing protein [Sorangium sp. So ce375]|uniref:DUF6484 domain-containing protein n=1 Tax=Sorangium sp. So ce375 TaxID=3133306 RepID=UPI003F5BEB60
MTGVEQDDGTDAVEHGAKMLLEFLLEEHSASGLEQPTLPERINGVVIGALAAFGKEGEARVVLPGEPVGDATARAMEVLSTEDVGRDVALLFEGGDPRRPVAMGLVHHPESTAQRLPGNVAAYEERKGRLMSLLLMVASIDCSRPREKLDSLLDEGLYRW